MALSEEVNSLIRGAETIAAGEKRRLLGLLERPDVPEANKAKIRRRLNLDLLAEQDALDADAEAYGQSQGEYATYKEGDTQYDQQQRRRDFERRSDIESRLRTLERRGDRAQSNYQIEPITTGENVDIRIKPGENIAGLEGELKDIEERLLAGQRVEQAPYEVTKLGRKDRKGNRRNFTVEVESPIGYVDPTGPTSVSNRKTGEVLVSREAQQRALRDKDRAAGIQAVRDSQRRARGEYTADELVKIAQRENYRQSAEPTTQTGAATAVPRETVTPQMVEGLITRPDPKIAMRNAAKAAIMSELEEASQKRMDFTGIEDLLPDKAISSANLPEAIASEYMPGGRGVYVDRQGQALGNDVNVSGANAPNTGQSLNAPQPQTASDFVATQVDALGLSKSEQFYPDKVSISAETGQLVTAAQQLENRRIKGRFPYREQGIANAASSVQSINALQKMSDLVKQVGLEAGANFYRLGEGGTKVKVDDPGVSDVLKYMGLSPAAQSRLGLAVQAMDKAGDGARSLVDAADRGIQVSQGPNSADIGRAPTKVQEAFRKGDNPEAREPFIGATAEDGPASYIKRPGNVPEGMEVGDFVKAQARERADANQKPLDIGRTRVNMEKARRAETRAGDARAVEIGRAALIGQPPAEPGMVGMESDVRAAQVEGQMQAAARARETPSLTPMGNPQPATPPVIAAAQSVAPPERPPIVPRPMTEVAGEAIGIGREIADRARRSRMGTAAGITGLGVGAGTVLNLLFGGDDE